MKTKYLDRYSRYYVHIIRFLTYTENQQMKCVIL